MSEPTTEKLAKAMQEAGCPAGMIERARGGYYDDFKSDLATPIIALVSDLTELHTTAAYRLAKLAKNGEFDATPEEADAWVSQGGPDIQEWWARLPRCEADSPGFAADQAEFLENYYRCAEDGD